MKATLSLFIGLVSSALLTASAPAKERLQEEFHRTYPLSAMGELRLDNVNGKVHITAWDRAEVKVDAIKRADRQEDLDQLKINISAKPDQVRIETKYPKTRSGWLWGKSQSASVDYEIKVPAQARLKDVQTGNGALEVEGVQGAINASTVNGHLSAKGLASDGRFESVNGPVQAAWDKLDGVKSVSLKTVNGRVDLTLPATADADVSGSTVNGGIEAGPGLTAKKNWPVGSELHGKLGKGGSKIKLETVNGGIHVRRHESGQAALAEQPQ